MSLETMLISDAACRLCKMHGQAAAVPCLCCFSHYFDMSCVLSCWLCVVLQPRQRLVC
jgi:hypothetical protein